MGGEAAAHGLIRPAQTPRPSAVSLVIRDARRTPSRAKPAPVILVTADPAPLRPGLQFELLLLQRLHDLATHLGTGGIFMGRTFSRRMMWKPNWVFTVSVNWPQ